jgi:hypothetical protein
MFPLPAWIDAAAWAEFVAARKFIKKPLSQGAAERQLKRLYAIKDAGHDPNAALLYSADHYYQDVYPAKDLEVERKAGSRADKTAEYLQSLDQGVVAPSESVRQKMAQLKLRRVA